MISKHIEWLARIEPVIVHPHCYTVGKSQDCFSCELHKNKTCNSPRGLCAREYPNHKRGCPNYNKKEGCPTDVLMFDMVYDLFEPVYAIYNMFDFGGHIERMREKHPKWSQRQLECCLYWQGSARKELRKRIAVFKAEFTEYTIIVVPEAMGVNVTETMKNIGIELEWPPRTITYQIAFAALAQ